MNELYNHPKIKAMVSFTKGEGFGRPLLEFSTTGKPIIAPNFSGHVDFLDKEMSAMLPGALTEVHEASIPKDYRFKGAQWFQVDFSAGSHFLKDIFTNYDKWLTKSYAQKISNEQFTLNKMTEKLGELIKPYTENIPEHVAVNLPKLQKKDDSLKLPKLKKVKK
jgi:hypothetical protein